MKSLNLQLGLFYLVLVAAVGFGLIDPASAQMFAFTGAVVNVTSTVITNADATPVVINKAYLARARVHCNRGVATPTNGDSINSTYRFSRIKSNDLVKALILDNATLGAACTMDFGLYETAANGGGVANAVAGNQSLFASAIDMNTAQRALDITRESGTITPANMEKRVWELLGLAKDPQKDYDVVGTLTAAAAATGAVCLQVEVIPTAG